jgi:hypothetical protein
VRFCQTIRFGCCAALWLGIGVVSGAPPAVALSLEDDSCTSIRSGASCLQWCKEVEQADQLDDLSTAKRSICGYLLRKDEAVALKTVACNQSACIYKLKRSKKDVYSCGGLRLRLGRRGSYGEGELILLATLTDGAGEKTVFESYCGAGPQCDPWSYERGAHAKSSLTLLDQVAVVRLETREPRKGIRCFPFVSASKNPVPGGQGSRPRMRLC